jgi:drug/metabolite transporter (DMT)-like permease
MKSPNSEVIGLVYGSLGVLGFSLSLPAARVAVAELDPTIVGLGRSVVAACLAILVLTITKQPIPPKKYWRGLAIAALGVVLGFPLLSAWAMQRLPAAYGGVVAGLIPLATTIVATIRVRERPSLKFWLASLTGTFTILIFMGISGAGYLQIADLALIGAVVSAAIGYVEGAKLAKYLGSWQVICWALIIVLPISIVPVGISIWQHGLHASPISWGAFAYGSLFPQFLCFFAWYHGMHLGGIAKVGQLQLIQPFLTLFFSGLLLRETITPLMLACAAIVITCVAVSRKAVVQR